MRKIVALSLAGTLVALGLLLVPLIGSLVAPSSGCIFGKVGAQESPCLAQEASLSALSFAATLDNLKAQATIASLQTQVTHNYPPSKLPSMTPVPSATLNPDSFDISKATPVKATFDAFEMPLPPGWTDLSAGSSEQFRFSYGDAQSSLAQLRVFVIERKDISTLLDLKVSVNTTEEAINKYKADLLPTDYPEIGEVTKSNIGKYEGFAVAYVAPPNPHGGSANITHIELRLADIPDTTKTIALVYFADGSVWDQVKGVIGQMIDAMVFNPQNVPTPTALPPTATPHPLEMTATYVQTLIIGLTPSPTEVSP